MLASRPPHVDPVIEYLFGLGDGRTTTWHTTADADLDGDGVTDAVSLDFDGDGRRDDAMWDTDGDGVADVAALDLDDDGTPDAFYRDGGKGVWDVATARPGGAAPQPPATPEPPARPHPPEPAPPRPSAPKPPPPAPSTPQPSTPQPSTPQPSTPQPSAPDGPPTRSQRVDLDGDGTDDLEIVGTRRAGVLVGGRLYVDEDGDGDFDRVLIDTDGDGRADVSRDARSPDFGRP